MANNAGGSPTQESFYGTWSDGIGCTITFTADTCQDVLDGEEHIRPISKWTAEINDDDETKAKYPAGFCVTLDHGSFTEPMIYFINSDGTALLDYTNSEEGAPYEFDKVSTLVTQSAMTTAPAGGPSCPSCGKAVETGKKFCKSCGAKLESEPAPPAPATPAAPIAGPACASCGQQFGADNAFCPKCGTKRESERACASCGQKLGPDNAFCPKCGTKCESERACASCGQKLDPDQAFCPKCGTKA